MEYEQIGERTALSDIYGRWTEFMKYVNRKVGSIHDHFIREYANFVANVALRFGGLDAIYRAPEIPNEAIGEYVREYEKMLVEWSNHLANIERREARFLADEFLADEAKRTAACDEADDSGHGEVGDNGCAELCKNETAPAEDEKADTAVKDEDAPAEKATAAGVKKGGRKPRP